MWDMLTGGAPYREVLRRALKPVFLIRFFWSMIVSLFSRNEIIPTPELTSSLQKNDNAGNSQTIEDDAMKLNNVLGKVYLHGEVILRKGDAADCMFVIQDGQVEVVGEFEGQEIRLAVGQPGEVIGEMAIFERQTRSATVRALGKARVLTIDEKTFLRYVHQDPCLAYQLLKMMSNRVRRLNSQVTYFKVIQRLAEKDIFPLPTWPA